MILVTDHYMYTGVLHPFGPLTGLSLISRLLKFVIAVTLFVTVKIYKKSISGYTGSL